MSESSDGLSWAVAQLDCGSLGWAGALLDWDSLRQVRVLLGHDGHNQLQVANAMGLFCNHLITHA